MVRLHPSPPIMFQITNITTLQEISEHIKLLREQKGKEKQVLVIIDKAINLGQGFTVNMLFERSLSYQHLVMNGDKKALAKMEASILFVDKYVQDNNLKEWKSRSYRFLGRLYDYKGDFSKAIQAYKKSIATVKSDPEPFRGLELEAFLAYSTMMSGEIKAGLLGAKKLFKKFNTNSKALTLKKKDYLTWAIWRSGIPIRTINALIDKKQLFNNKEMLKWLAEAEKDLAKGDFSYRKAEIKTLKQKLQEN